MQSLDRRTLNTEGTATLPLGVLDSSEMFYDLKADNRQTDTRPSISLVYPAYNEESNIRNAVEQALQVFSKHFRQMEIIIVNDGSQDDTGMIIDQLAMLHENVVALHHKQNRGYGAAVSNGLYQATNELVFFTDSDMQFDLNEITRLLDHIEDYDIVTGYRENRADPFHRRMNAWGWGVLIRTVLGVKVRDLDCAFKLFRRQVFQTIDVRSAGAMVNAEILSQANKHNFTLKEVPVSHYARTAGTQTGANLQVIMKAFRELFKLYGDLRRA